VERNSNIDPSQTMSSRRHFLRRSGLVASGLALAQSGFLFSEEALLQKLPSLTPGEPVDYGALAFQPQVWKEKNQSTLLYPWEGKEIVFLTTSAEFDQGLMAQWVKNLDGGWRLYEDLTGGRPRPFKTVNGKPCIAAVPSPEYTCGVGCGFIGVTGIELAKFYDQDYPALRANPGSMPHYVYYEMGRNFFTFGDRHSCFTTGFAVFMRYMCMDHLKLADNDARTRKVIDQAEAGIRTSKLSFFKMFTNADGMSEKQPRLSLQPSDQPVTYASAMLRLHREFGKEEWLKRFFRTVSVLKPGRPASMEGARQQSWNWLLASSVAAKQDLTPIFVEDWRLPLAEGTIQQLSEISWKDAPLETLKSITPEWI
jgi:hypothetical protein